MNDIELGLDTFGDVTLDADGKMKPQDQVLRDVVEQGVVADQAGVFFLGLGEHHRDDFAISSPEVVLGAIAGRTEKLRLGTAVTVLSSDDPVRVFQRFSTLNAVSDGRAEVILGRGSFKKEKETKKENELLKEKERSKWRRGNGEIKSKDNFNKNVKVEGVKQEAEKERKVMV